MSYISFKESMKDLKEVSSDFCHVTLKFYTGDVIHDLRCSDVIISDESLIIIGYYQSIVYKMKDIKTIFVEPLFRVNLEAIKEEEE